MTQDVPCCAWTRATEAQATAERGYTRPVYKFTKTLRGNKPNKLTFVNVEDKKIHVLTKEEELNRRAEHFWEVLDRDDPDVSAGIQRNTSQQLEMKQTR